MTRYVLIFGDATQDEDFRQFYRFGSDLNRGRMVFMQIIRVQLIPGAVQFSQIKGSCVR